MKILKAVFWIIVLIIFCNIFSSNREEVSVPQPVLTKMELNAKEKDQLRILQNDIDHVKKEIKITKEVTDACYNKMSVNKILVVELK